MPHNTGDPSPSRQITCFYLINRFGKQFRISRITLNYSYPLTFFVSFFLKLHLQIQPPMSR